MNESNYTKLDRQIHHQKKPIDIYLVAVLVLISFHVIGNIIWIYLNNVPPPSDAGLHTVLSLRFTEYIKTNLFNFNIIYFLKISNYYTPFTHLVGAFLDLLVTITIN
jgi:hypothetical protein